MSERNLLFGEPKNREEPEEKTLADIFLTADHVKQSDVDRAAHIIFENYVQDLVKDGINRENVLLVVEALSERKLFKRMGSTPFRYTKDDDVEILGGAARIAGFKEEDFHPYIDILRKAILDKLRDYLEPEDFGVLKNELDGSPNLRRLDRLGEDESVFRKIGFNETGGNREALKFLRTLDDVPEGIVLPEIVDDESDHVVLELKPGLTSLGEINRKQWGAPDDILKHIKDAVDLCVYLKSVGLMMRDIKLSNFEVDTSGKVFIVDLETLFFLGENEKCMYTPGYMPPEFHRTDDRGRLETKSEEMVWQLGVAMDNIFQKIQASLPADVRAEFSDLIWKMQEMHPDRRPTLKYVVAVMEDLMGQLKPEKPSADILAKRGAVDSSPEPNTQLGEKETGVIPNQFEIQRGKQKPNPPKDSRRAA